MTGAKDPTRAGRYILRAMLNGRQVNAPQYGWDDLADALFVALELAENAPRSSSWIIADRADDVDLVRIGFKLSIDYLA